VQVKAVEASLKLPGAQGPQAGAGAPGVLPVPGGPAQQMAAPGADSAPAAQGAQEAAEYAPGVEEEVDAGQGVQAALPGAAQAPRGQHTAEPSEEKSEVGGAQGAHAAGEVAPTAVLNVFWGQAVHVVLPLAGLKVPGLHGWHAAGVTGYVPAGQLDALKRQALLPRTLNASAAQGVHAEVPPSEKKPASHSAQPPWGDAKLPAAHAVQVSAPGGDALPGGHAVHTALEVAAVAFA